MSTGKQLPSFARIMNALSSAISSLSGLMVPKDKGSRLE